MSSDAPARRPRRAVARFRPMVVAAALVLVLATAGWSARPTSATWNEAAYFASGASSGSWVTPNTCEVRKSDGTVDTKKTCTVQVGNGGTFWPSPPDQGNFAFSVNSSAKVANDEYFTFSVTLPQAPSTGWSAGQWAITSLYSGAVLTSSCSALPLVAGRTQPNLGNSPTVGGPLVLNPTPGTSVVCQP